MNNKNFYNQITCWAILFLGLSSIMGSKLNYNMLEDDNDIDEIIDNAKEALLKNIQGLRNEEAISEDQEKELRNICTQQFKNIKLSAKKKEKMFLTFVEQAKNLEFQTMQRANHVEKQMIIGYGKKYFKYHETNTQKMLNARDEEQLLRIDKIKQDNTIRLLKSELNNVKNQLIHQKKMYSLAQSQHDNYQKNIDKIKQDNTIRLLKNELNDVKNQLTHQKKMYSLAQSQHDNYQKNNELMAIKIRNENMLLMEKNEKLKKEKANKVNELRKQLLERENKIKQMQYEMSKNKNEIEKLLNSLGFLKQKNKNFSKNVNKPEKKFKETFYLFGRYSENDLNELKNENNELRSKLKHQNLILETYASKFSYKSKEQYFRQQPCVNINYFEAQNNILSSDTMILQNDYKENNSDHDNNNNFFPNTNEKFYNNNVTKELFHNNDFIGYDNNNNNSNYNDNGQLFNQNYNPIIDNDNNNNNALSSLTSSYQNDFVTKPNNNNNNNLLGIYTVNNNNQNYNK